jgi:hypothetical protein
LLEAAATSDSAPCPCQRRPCARYKLLPPCFPDTAGRARKQKNGPEDRFNTLISFRKSDPAKGFEPSTPTLARECCYALRPVDFRDTISFANLDACREDGFAADRRVPVHLAVDELQCSKAYWKKFERLVTTSRR